MIIHFHAPQIKNLIRVHRTTLNAIDFPDKKGDFCKEAACTYMEIWTLWTVIMHHIMKEILGNLTLIEHIEGKRDQGRQQTTYLMSFCECGEGILAKEEPHGIESYGKPQSPMYWRDMVYRRIYREQHFNHFNICVLNFQNFILAFKFMFIFLLS